jgi:hypothetical protein
MMSSDKLVLRLYWYRSRRIWLSNDDWLRTDISKVRWFPTCSLGLRLQVNIESLLVSCFPLQISVETVST